MNKKEIRSIQLKRETSVNLEREYRHSESNSLFKIIGVSFITGQIEYKVRMVFNPSGKKHYIDSNNYISKAGEETWIPKVFEGQIDKESIKLSEEHLETDHILRIPSKIPTISS